MTPVSFVSLGPGDPELITLKGLRILRQADRIYCPSVLTSSGKERSRSGEILLALEIRPEQIRRFHLPMNKHRDAALAAYDRVCEEARQAYRNGEKIVIVAEGDAGFYSSVQYICDQMTAAGVPVLRTAGVPAFIAAGALAGLHIAKQEEPLLVLPGIAVKETAVRAIEEGTNLVIMKLSQSESAVKAILKELSQRCPEIRWHYFENIGAEGEFHTCDPEAIQKRDFPYFSLMIVCR